MWVLTFTFLTLIPLDLSDVSDRLGKEVKQLSLPWYGSHLLVPEFWFIYWFILVHLLVPE